MNGFSSMPRVCAFSLALAACFAASRATADPLSVFESATPFDESGFRSLRLSAATLGSADTYVYKHDTVSFPGVASDQGVVRGSSPGNYAAPVIDAAGDVFGGKYLSTGNSGFINIAFATPQQSLSLLWGSMDPGNEITFLDGNRIVGFLDGAEIDPGANGFQAAGGSAYVLIDSALKFNDIEIGSITPSFEIAELKTSPAEIPINEPASLALFSSFLLGLVGVRHARRTEPCQEGHLEMTRP